MMAGKWEPFDLNGSVFRPLAKLLYVEEPDFGCEGVPEDGVVYGSIVLEDKNGQRTVKIEEQQLFASRLDDGMWIGKLAGKTVLLDSSIFISQMKRSKAGCKIFPCKLRHSVC